MLTLILYIVLSAVISLIYFIIEEIYAGETEYKFYLSPKELLKWL